MIDYFIRIIKNKHNSDISNNNIALSKLKKHVEIAKRALSSVLDY